MNKKHIKLIMELIFIFILPLVFICFTSEIQVEREFTYDNNGNYETSQETKNLSFDNSIIKYTKQSTKAKLIGSVYAQSEQEEDNYYFDQILSLYLSWNNASNTYKEDVLGETDKEYLFQSPNGAILNYETEKLYWLINSNSNFFELSYRVSTYPNPNPINEDYAIYFYDDEKLLHIEANQDYYLTPSYIVDYTQFEDNLYYYAYEIPNNIDWGINYTVNSTSFTLINGENNLDLIFNCICEYDFIYPQINTIWGNIKQLLIDNLDLNDNVLLDIVLCYTLLWITMWILWHILYGFLELIIHIIPRRE